MNNKRNFLKASFVSEKSLPTENKKCILLISVGQRYHEDDKLAATIDLINKSKFSSCLIAIADTLQRHNYLDKSLDEAYQTSLLMGDEWINRNINIINRLNPKVEILRWDDALQNEQYAFFKQKIEKEYQVNNSYQNAIHTTISSFTDRVKHRDPYANIDLIFSNCLKYLIEECPIIMPLWASQGYDFVIYPKPMTKAMAMTHELFVKPIYHNKGDWLSLKFKKLAIAMNDQKAFVINERLNYKLEM